MATVLMYTTACTCWATQVCVCLFNCRTLLCAAVGVPHDVDLMYAAVTLHVHA
jgi:hypothetical protein